MKTHEIDECCCLWGDCRKRHLIINDVFNNQEVKIIVCNEFLRLKIHEINYRNNRESDYMKYRWHAESVFAEIFCDIIPTKYKSGVINLQGNVDNYADLTWRSRRNRKFSESNLKEQNTISYDFCERPHIKGILSVYDGLKILREHSWGVLNYSLLKDSVFEYLENLFYFLLKKTSKKKYHNESKYLLSKLQKNRSVDSDVIERITQLLFELKIINNECTSKQ